MRWLLLITLLFANTLAWCQPDTLNQTDADGKRQGHWILYGVDRPDAGIPDSGKVEEGRYVDDRKTGVWIKYHKDGITPRLKGEYKNNRPNGSYSKYYDSGTLQEEGQFYRGKYFGDLARYHRNGNLRYLGVYDGSGREVGDSYYFFSNGCKETLYRHDTASVVQLIVHYDKERCNEPKDTIIPMRSSCFANDKTVAFDYAQSPVHRREKKSTKVKTWRIRDEHYIDYSDAVICKELNEKGEYLNPGNLLYFKGTCKDDHVWKGTMYFYDKSGKLERTELWSRGRYKRTL